MIGHLYCNDFYFSLREHLCNKPKAAGGKIDGTSRKNITAY